MDLNKVMIIGRLTRDPDSASPLALMILLSIGWTPRFLEYPMSTPYESLAMILRGSRITQKKKFTAPEKQNPKSYQLPLLQTS